MNTENYERYEPCNIIRKEGTNIGTIGPLETVGSTLSEVYWLLG